MSLSPFALFMVFKNVGDHHVLVVPSYTCASTRPLFPRVTRIDSSRFGDDFKSPYRSSPLVHEADDGELQELPVHRRYCGYVVLSSVTYTHIASVELLYR